MDSEADQVFDLDALHTDVQRLKAMARLRGDIDQRRGALIGLPEVEREQAQRVIAILELELRELERFI